MSEHMLQKLQYIFDNLELFDDLEYVLYGLIE